MQKHNNKEVLTKALSKIVHELKNPISSIDGFMQLLPKKHDSKKFWVNFIKTIDHDIARLKELTLRLSEFVKPNELVFIRNDIHTILENAIIVIQKIKGVDKSKIIVEKEKDLPQVICDRRAILQVFIDIMSNSFETQRKNPNLITVNVIIRNSPEKGAIEILFKDNGPGIKDNQVDKIFDPFFSKRHRALGLGLTFAKRIINGHKGEISARTFPGKGTEIIIKLPSG